MTVPVSIIRFKPEVGVASMPVQEGGFSFFLENQYVLNNKLKCSLPPVETL